MGGAILLATLLLIPGCLPNSQTDASSPSDDRQGAAAKHAALDDDSDDPVSVLLINGEAITVEEVLRPIRKDLRERADSMSPEAYGRHLVERLQERVRTLARDTLLNQEASKNLTDQESEAIDGFVDQSIRDRVTREFGGRQTRYEAALSEQGLSLEEDRERVRRELIVTRWIHQTIVRKVADPTRDELWRFFESQKEAFSKPPRRQMALIEISILGKVPSEVTAPTDEQLRQARDAAYQQASLARSEILAGGDFAEVAKRTSDGLYAKSGGRWGWVTRGSVRDRWAPAVQALFDLPDVGIPSEVIETPDAFFIVQAVEIEPGQQADFETLQPKLVKSYRDMQFNAMVEEELARLHTQAHIRPKNVGRFLNAVLAAAPQSQMTDR